MKPVRVAFLGPLASFSHYASIKFFGNDNVQFEPLPTIHDIFQAAENGQVNYGVVPVENSLEGFVGTTLDYLHMSQVQVIKAGILPIKLSLVSRSSKLSDIKIVYSHPVALGQARDWLYENLPHATLIETKSTSEAITFVLSDKNTGAIVSPLAIELFDLNVLASNLQKQESYTRFFVVTKAKTQKTNCQGKKAAITFVLDNKPGTLFKVLEAFNALGINLTSITSRPGAIQNLHFWSYKFFAEFEFASCEQVSLLFKTIEPKVKSIKLLGTYNEVLLA